MNTKERISIAYGFAKFEAPWRPEILHRWTDEWPIYIGRHQNYKYFVEYSELRDVAHILTI